MWVVKLGGSLASDPALLRRWLEVLSASGAGRVVIVPGGGPFADRVREAQAVLGFSDATAHRMAILAMEQFALMLAGLVPTLTPSDSEEGIRQVVRGGGVALWLPAAMTIDNSEIPESWDVTSDSLAAWLAQRLRAERLILVKCAAMAWPDREPLELSRLGIVDAAFPEFAARSGLAPRVLTSGDHQTMGEWLANSALLGQSLERPG